MLTTAALATIDHRPAGLFVLLAILAVAALVGFFLKRKPFSFSVAVTSAETEAGHLETDAVTDVDTAKTEATGTIHSIDLAVLAKLHALEEDCVLAKDTVQRYVDAHIFHTASTTAPATEAGAAAATVLSGTGVLTAMPTVVTAASTA